MMKVQFQIQALHLHLWQPQNTIFEASPCLHEALVTAFGCKA
jgi:hypothetical protein